MSGPSAWVSRLHAETAEWVRAGVVTQAQADAIHARYTGEPPAVEEAPAGGRFVAIIAGLGAVLLGVGVILFFAANWQAIPRQGKLGLALGAIAITYWVAWRLAFGSGRYPRSGRALLLLGAILYGAAIWLVAQLYHMSGHLPRGLGLWIVGILPLAYVARSAAVAGLAAGLAVLWFGAAAADVHETVLSPFIAVGIALWALGRLHARRHALRFASRAYAVVGLAAALFAVYLLTFASLGPFDHYADAGASLRAGAYAVAVALAVLLLGAERATPAAVAEAAVLAILLGVAATEMPGRASGARVVLVNLVLLGAVLGAVAVGVRERTPAFVNVALAMFALDVATRYFDFFYGLMPRSLFFMGGGVLLIAGGVFLEGRRRRVIAAIQGGAA